MAQHTETTEEFLARGGKIKKLPPVEHKKERELVRIKPPTISDVMTLADGQLYFSQKNIKKNVAKK